MPIGSMIERFRAELEAHMEAARERRGITGLAGTESALAAQGALHRQAGGADVAATGAGAQAPGEHRGAPGTQRGGA